MNKVFKQVIILKILEKFQVMNINSFVIILSIWAFLCNCNRSIDHIHHILGSIPQAVLVVPQLVWRLWSSWEFSTFVRVGGAKEEKEQEEEW